MLWITRQALRLTLLYAACVICVNVLRTPLPGLPAPVANTIAATVTTTYTAAAEMVAEATQAASPALYAVGSRVLHAIESSRPVTELSVALRESLERSLTRS